MNDVTNAAAREVTPARRYQASTMSTRRQVREEQRRLYGEPLSDRINRIQCQLDLNRKTVASILGLSEAMVSQLASGDRIKVANPHAADKLKDLRDLGDAVQRGVINRRQAEAQIEVIRSRQPAGAVQPRRSNESAAELERQVRALESDLRGMLVRRGGSDDLPESPDVLRDLSLLRALEGLLATVTVIYAELIRKSTQAHSEDGIARLRCRHTAGAEVTS